MLISREMSFEDLERNSWSGAIDTIRTVREAGKEDELMDFLESIFIDILHGNTGVEGDVDTVGDDVCQTIDYSIYLFRGNEHIACIWS